MATDPSRPLTRLLAAAGRGDASAHHKLWVLVYDELHRLAQHQVAKETPGRTRQPTSLVHEAYLRLTAGQNIEWANRRHFFAAAAKAMRHIRIDDARKRNSLKRGGGRQSQPLDEDLIPHPQRGRGTPAPAAGWGTPVSEQDPAELLAVDEALGKLEQTDPRKAEVVMLRYFAGLTVDETASALDVSPRTVDNEWRYARAWLHRQLSEE